MNPNRGRVTTVVIQDRIRLFRESLRLVVEESPAIGKSPGIDVTAAVATGDELERFVHDTAADAVILEIQGIEWDVRSLLRRLTTERTGITIIGTAPSGSRHAPVDGVAVVPRTAPGAVFVGLLTGAESGSVHEWPGGAVRPGQSGVDLTQRELQVLALISGGSTTRQIADRLGISVKTVESRRHSLFGKLGVQSQSHAVAVGMRLGIIGDGSVAVGSGATRGPR